MRLSLPHFFRLPVWLLLVAALLAAGGMAQSQPAKKPPVVTAEVYRRELQDALEKLRRMENHKPRPLLPLLKSLIKERTVKRADGATQEVKAEQLEGLQFEFNPLVVPPMPVPPAKPGVKPPPAPAAKPPGPDRPRSEVVKVRAAVEEQLKALDEWAPAKGGPYYTSADAQAIVKQLEDSNQIRIGPSWWQKKMEEWQQTFSDWMKAVDKWFRSLFPAPTTTASAPDWDLSWVKYLFYGVVASLLAVILWLIFRALSGRFGHRSSREEKVLQGEDAELLLLPPDELRSRAQIFADEGNFREALRHRYLSLLLVLDSRGVWRYDTRRTNWEHIGALRKNPVHQPLIAPLSELTRRFDRVRYGGAECSPEEWQQYNSDAGALEHKVGGAVRV